jgi:hypothetical protein
MCLATTWLACALCGAPAGNAESLVKPAAISATGYCCNQPATNMIDGDLGTAWNSGGVAPASVIVDMGQHMDLSRVELLTSQSPDGVTEHQISVSDDLVLWTSASSVTQDTTDDEWLSVPINMSARYIAISTVLSPSWVAWRELRVFQQSGTSSN